jgi:hypothetical protein
MVTQAISPPPPLATLGPGAADLGKTHGGAVDLEKTRRWRVLEDLGGFFSKTRSFLNNS